MINVYFLLKECYTRCNNISYTKNYWFDDEREAMMHLSRPKKPKSLYFQGVYKYTRITTDKEMKTICTTVVEIEKESL